MCKCNFDIKYLDKYKSPFYKQVLESWYEMQDVDCKNEKDIMKQRLWFNKYILVENKPIFIETLYNKSITRICDLLMKMLIFYVLTY